MSKDNSKILNDNESSASIVDYGELSAEVKVKIITGVAVGDGYIELNSKEDFPEQGIESIIYCDKENDELFRWDVEKEEYICVGTDYNNIHTISCGKAYIGDEDNPYGEKTEETMSVPLSMAEGDQLIFPTAQDKVLAYVTVEKPDTLEPQNIKKDIDIGGVVGTLQNADEVALLHKDIDLNFASGNMHIESDAGTAYSTINVNKPTALVPKNIKKFVEIAGIQGTYESDLDINNVDVELNFEGNTQVISPNVGETFNDVIIHKPANLIPQNIVDGVNIAGVTGIKDMGNIHGNFYAMVFDFDGKVYKDGRYNAGDVFTLPAAPDRTDEGLEFTGWQSVYDIVDNGIEITENNVLVGASYRTVDGSTKIFVTIPSASTEVNLCINKSNTSNLIVYWGDGFISNSVKSGVDTIYHAYVSPGDYVINIVATANYTLGHNAATGWYLLNNIASNEYITKIYIGDFVTELGQQCLQYCLKLQSISISPSVTRANTQTFGNCASLMNIIFPNTLTGLNNNMLMNCSSLKNAIIASRNTYNLSSTFANCYSLVYVNFYMLYGNNMFQFCTSLDRIVIGNGINQLRTTYSAVLQHAAVTYITSVSSHSVSGSNALTNCVVRYADLSKLSWGNVPNNACTGLRASYLKINQPSSIGVFSCATYGGGAFNSANAGILDLTNLTQLVNLSNVNWLPATANSSKILVKQSLRNSFRASTNWSSYYYCYVGIPDSEIED